MLLDNFYFSLTTKFVKERNKLIIMKKCLIFLFFTGCSIAALAQPSTDEVFVVVEEMPRFPGCEDYGDLKAKKRCAKEELNQYIAQNLVYPAEARKNGVEGVVVIRFIVRPDGTISNARINRDIGHGCGQAALKLITDMNAKGLRWTPGMQRNQKVAVQFNLPVKFTL